MSAPSYRKPTVVAVLNQKGGVGKTSTTFHLGGALASMGQVTVLVDNDPQASLTQGIYGPAAAESLPVAETILPVYSTTGGPGLVITTAVDARLGLVAGCGILADHNTTRPIGGWGDNQLALREFIDDEVEALHPPIRWVLIDCPPNLQLLSQAALVAADLVVVPVQAEDYGVQGIVAVERFAAEVRASLNPGLADPLFLVTQFDRRCRLPRVYEQELREIHGERVLKTVIPRSVEFPEAVLRRRPVTHAKPHSSAADAMRQLAEELIVVDAERARLATAAAAAAAAGKAVAR